MRRSTAATRRTILAAGLATLAAPVLARRRGFFAARGIAPGLQLYTLGDLLPRDPDATLARIAAAGIRHVETAGLDGRSVPEWRRLLDRHGLAVTSAHVPYATGAPNLRDGAPALAALYAPLGPRHLTLAAPILPARFDAEPPRDWAGFIRLIAERTTPDDWKRMADQLDRAGRAVKAEGLRLAYHNHDMEFAPQGDRHGLDLLLANTDPALVDFELDVGWAVAAGQDPMALLRRWPGRFRLLHVKDVATTVPPPIVGRMRPANVGDGIVDWRRLLPAAWAAGVRRFYLEQEPPFAGGRLAAVEAGARFLRAL